MSEALITRRGGGENQGTPNTLITGSAQANL